MNPPIGRRALALGLLLGAAGRPVLAAIPISRMDLRWWRERHAAVLARLRQGPVDLVFVGDSITQNWERDGPEPWARFRPVWERFYGDRRAVNLGFSGDATSHVLWRLEHGEIDAIAPKAAVVLVGANNLGRLHWSAEDTLAGLAAIVEALRARLPTTRILLLGVLPSDRSAWASATTLQINRGLAARYGAGSRWVTYLDLARLFLRDGRTDPDQFYDPKLSPPEAPLHPTAAAQQRLAEAIEPTLSTMLGDRNRAG